MSEASSQVDSCQSYVVHVVNVWFSCNPVSNAQRSTGRSRPGAVSKPKAIARCRIWSITAWMFSHQLGDFHSKMRKKVDQTLDQTYAKTQWCHNFRDLGPRHGSKQGETMRKRMTGLSTPAPSPSLSLSLSLCCRCCDFLSTARNIHHPTQPGVADRRRPNGKGPSPGSSGYARSYWKQPW